MLYHQVIKYFVLSSPNVRRKSSRVSRQARYPIFAHAPPKNLVINVQTAILQNNLSYVSKVVTKDHAWVSTSLIGEAPHILHYAASNNCSKEMIHLIANYAKSLGISFA